MRQQVACLLTCRHHTFPGAGAGHQERSLAPSSLPAEGALAPWGGPAALDRAEIIRAAERFERDYPHFIRRTPLWKLPGKALGAEPSEENLAWLRDVQERLAALDGAEALIDGFGASSGRPPRTF